MAVKGGEKQAIQKTADEVVSGNETEYCFKTKPINALVKEQYDYVAVTYPSATQEVYAFKTGGSGGTTVATVTVNYTDSTKANISNVAKT